MKKFSLLTTLVLAAILIVSCTSTKAGIEPIEPVAIERDTGGEATVISEPLQAEPVVIDTAPPITSEEAGLEQKFSYVYGYLIGANILAENLDLNIEPFIQGSGDFYSYAEPLLDEEGINQTFGMYQDYLDGNITEEELVASYEGFATFVDQFSYSYGFVIQFNLQSQGLILEIDDFHSGLRDAFKGIALDYTEEQIDELFIAYQQKLVEQYLSMVEDYKEANLEEAEEFLAENGQLPDVYTTEEGLQYKVIVEGSGPKPSDDSRALVDYMITFLDGTIGENSYDGDEPEVFAMQDLPPVIANAAKMMNEGSHYRFYVHPSLAYGAEGTDTVPPNALLIVDVELHELLD
ncbi:MAG: FKBP-type peptidyl-prolyl cis-trans isomerase N-terminal domain-containing protein [Sphaerochaetaceae bacterium]